METYISIIGKDNDINLSLIKQKIIIVITDSNPLTMTQFEALGKKSTILPAQLSRFTDCKKSTLNEVISGKTEYTVIEYSKTPEIAITAPLKKDDKITAVE